MKKHYQVKRKKGQLIIFGILIFPVIFICLAMVINVGMVVHDKINLQNSVDLAAIYAAQKQAEVMDAMAHINYQMRQSYKLLAWRYLVVGNSGAFVEPTLHPDVVGFPTGGSSFRRVMNILNNNSPSDRALCPNAGFDPPPGNPRAPGGVSHCAHTFCDTLTKQEACPYAVCTIHPLFYAKWYTDNTHLCQNYTLSTSTRDLPTLTPVSGPFVTAGLLAGNNRVQALRQELSKNCADVGFINWLVAASMYLSFFIDQQTRKRFVEEKLFPLLQKGHDIEDQPIKNGVFKTIQKNLTYVNYKKFNNLTFKLVKSNPQAEVDPELNPRSSQINFEAFYKWDTIDPVLLYVQNTKNDNRNLSRGQTTFCTTTVQTIFQCDPNETTLGLAPLSEVDSRTTSTPSPLQRIVDHRPDPGDPTWCDRLKGNWRNERADRVSGFYKKNNVTNLGVKVEVEILYSGQLFFPFFTTTIIPLKAVAYAKAFGASFGPSNPIDDDLLIPRSSAHTQSRDLFPNYSRFPGDRAGLLSERVQRAWNLLFTKGQKSIADSSDDARKEAEEQGRTFNNYSDLTQNVGKYKDPMLLEYEVVSTITTTTGTANIVTLTPGTIFTKTMKIYEEMAIAPDQFDIQYYTILPNYMTTLYPKLKKVFPDVPSVPGVPSDLGHLRGANINLTDDNVVPLSLIYRDNNRDHTPEFRLNYIEKQIIYANKQPAVLLGSPNVFGGYKVNSIDQLLTSWAPDLAASFANSNDMYNSPPWQNCTLDDQEVKLTFGNVSQDHFLNDGLERKMIPSHCLKGGRTGFSVKLIHPDVL